MADQEKRPSVNYRITSADAAPILLMAGLFDIISIVPLANDVNVFIAQPLLFLAFVARGVNPLARRNWVWFLVAWIVELIPGFSAFPTFMLESLRWITISHIEDDLKARGLNLEDIRTKALVGRFLNQKKVAEQIQEMESKAVAAAGKPKGGEGPSDVGKQQEKQQRITDARGNLDKALATKDANSGIAGDNRRTRSERYIGSADDYSPEDLGRRRTEIEITDYGNTSPEERAAANADNVSGPAPYRDAA